MNYMRATIALFVILLLSSTLLNAQKWEQVKLVKNATAKSIEITAG